MESIMQATGKETPIRVTVKGAPQALAGTKLKIAEAAMATLKVRGFAGASAREIADSGGFNQALIFYHFGSVQKALLAALDLVSARRMRAYRPAFERAQTIPELASLAREIYAEDLQNGYVTVLGEMVAGGVTDAELGAEVVARIQPWIDMVESKLRELLSGSPFESMLPAGDVAFAVVALYLGVDMLGHLEGGHARAESLLALGERYAPLLEALLPSRPPGEQT
ncbi:MAG TPA: TetR/AcrR family transcriptional regulator [Solirubrobacteraceae bacterium]|jgi:AcrR family transcriptional regulator|nr:TetR/AcrR family transcriptional regulator [Solirubrobacteraceae bacterium]